MRITQTSSTSAWIEIVSRIGTFIGGGTLHQLLASSRKALGHFQKESIYRHSTSEIHGDRYEHSNLSNGTWLRAVKIDVAGSFIAVFIFSAAFMVLGSVILHEPSDSRWARSPFPSGILPDQPASILLILYRIGIFTAIGGTLFATFDVWTKSVYEGLVPFKKKAKLLIAIGSSAS